MKLHVDIFSAPKYSECATCIRSLDAELDRKNNTVTLSDGTVLELNRNYYSIIEPHLTKYDRPIWIYREDEYDWYLAHLKDQDQSPLYVRKNGAEWITSRNSKAISIEQIELKLPTRKLIKCKQVALTNSGDFNETTQFYWATKKFLYRERFDGTKIRYPKKQNTEIPLAVIMVNDEITEYIYPK